MSRYSHGTKSTNPEFSNRIIDKNTQVITDFVDLTKLPEFGVLSKQVSETVQSSSWWERYGLDWLIHGTAAVCWVASHWLIGSSQPAVVGLGIFVLGCSHYTITFKAAHMLVHDAGCASRAWNRFWYFISSDVMGCFSADIGYNIHIKCHHPHTNIVGLGDSSTWKAPFLPRYVYMFLAPLLLPPLIPLVSIKELIEQEPVWKTVRHMLLSYPGLAFHVYLLMTVSELTFKEVLLVIFLSRNVLSIPYIHVNIFQHIGLPMYCQQHRPKKIYQMTTGVLNLSRNIVLDYCFGHSIMSCHTEHHLFPRLSDNMCLKVKPLVRRFCLERGLPYHEDTYTSRVTHFLENYNSLMVNAPPITKFVGLQ